MAGAAQLIEIAVVGAHIIDGAKFLSWQSAILRKQDTEVKSRMEKGKRRSPMELVMTCTTAESMLLVGVCDYLGVAKGIGAASFGKKWFS
jgi:hypothetical protein